MPASLSNLTTNRARLARNFPDGSSFFIDYRPSQVTPRQLHRIQALQHTPLEQLPEAEQAEVIDMLTKILADTIIATDALASNGQPIVPTLEGLQDVSYTDQQALLELIQMDQQLGKTSGTGNDKGSSLPVSVSSAKEMTTPSSPPSLNGTAPASAQVGSTSSS